MTQTIRPISTISSGSWVAQGDSTLHECTDEVSQDGDTTRAEGASGCGTFELKLGTATDPVSAANHTVKLWGKGVGSGAGEKVDVFLYELTTLIATVANNWTPGRGSYAEVSYTLSAGEANAISDYSDLRVRVVEDTIGGGSERFNVTQVYMEIPDPAAVLTQSHFRVRDNDNELINSSTFSHARNANATIDAETLFRIRFEIGSDGDDTDTYKIQENYDSEGWVDLEAPGLSPPAGVGVVRTSYAPSAQYADGVATTNVMSGEGGTFVAGSGEESNNTASVTLAAGEHTEFEFCLIIRKLYGDDGTSWGFTTDGDTVQYRLVKSDGTVLAYTNTPTITVNHAARLIGGVFAETSGMVGPFRDDNGNLYVIVEHAQLPTPIIPCMLKSTDGGDTWIPQDDADWASSTIELEAADGHHISADDKIYLGMTSSTDPDYREYQTSAHGTPDAWTAASVEVTAVGTVSEQVQAIVRRSDGTVVMFYNEISTDGKLRYKIRSSGGSWGSQLTLEGEAGTDWSSCQIVLGASDLIHIIYSGDAAGDPIYYRNLNSSDTLSGRTSLTTDTDADNFSPFLKPVYWDDGGTEKIYLIYYKTTPNKLYSRIVTSGSVGSESASAIIDNAVASNIASSGQPTAKAVVDGTDVYVIYAEETTQDLFLTKSQNGGSFDTDAEILDGVTVDLMSANLFTHNAGNGSAKVIGVVYSDNRFGAGNTGDVVYWEYELSVVNLKSVAGALTFVGSQTKETRVNRTGALTFAGSVIKKSMLLRAGAISFAGSVVKKTKVTRAGAITFAGAVAGAKLVLKALSGAVTFTGTATKKTMRGISGGISFLGTAIKSTKVGRAGALTFAGAVTSAQTFTKVLAGALTFAGSAVKKSIITRAGAISFAGSARKKTKVSRAGAITFAGTVAGAKTFVKAIAGAITFAGSVIRKSIISRAGAISFAGALAAQKIAGEFFQAVGGAITFTGSAVKKSIISRAGAVTFLGSARKKTKVSRSGAITFAGTVAGSVRFIKAVGGAISFAGSAVKKSIISRVGAITFAGSTRKKTKVSRAGVISFAGAVASSKKFAKVLAGAITFAGSAVKKTIITRAGEISFVGSAIKKTIVSRAGAIAFAGALATQKLVSQYTQAVGGAITFAGSMRKKTKVKRSGSISFVGSVARLLIDLWRELTLRPRTVTLTLDSRTNNITLTLKTRTITFTLPDL